MFSSQTTFRDKAVRSIHYCWIVHLFDNLYPIRQGGRFVRVIPQCRKVSPLQCSSVEQRPTTFRVLITICAIYNTAQRGPAEFFHSRIQNFVTRCLPNIMPAADIYSLNFHETLQLHNTILSAQPNSDTFFQASDRQLPVDPVECYRAIYRFSRTLCRIPTTQPNSVATIP